MPEKNVDREQEILTRVRIGNLIGFIWIQPDLLLATAQDTGCQALLEPEHAGKKIKVLFY